MRDQANEWQASVYLGTDGALEVRRASSPLGIVLGRTIPIIGAGAYQPVEIYAKAGNADGAIEIRVDEITRLNLSGRDTAAAAFHTELLRVYTSADAIGVEVGGAVKNVMAIAAGLCDGLAAADDASTAGRPGHNARAALITRGLAEMTRLGVALGARPETFMGLSGLGDLVLTATGDLSRNRKVGLGLAAGRPLAQVLAELGHVAEGVYSAPMVLARARAAGVEMPITAAVVAVLDGSLGVQEAVRALMGRGPRAES